jgi:hypothetical protein
LDILFLILRKFSRWGETYIIKNVVIYLKSSKSNLTLWIFASYLAAAMHASCPNPHGLQI